MTAPLLSKELSELEADIQEALHLLSLSSRSAVNQALLQLLTHLALLRSDLLQQITTQQARQAYDLDTSTLQSRSPDSRLQRTSHPDALPSEDRNLIALLAQAALKVPRDAPQGQHAGPGMGAWLNLADSRGMGSWAAPSGCEPSGYDGSGIAQAVRHSAQGSDGSEVHGSKGFLEADVSLADRSGLAQLGALPTMLQCDHQQPCRGAEGSLAFYAQQRDPPPLSVSLPASIGQGPRSQKLRLRDAEVQTPMVLNGYAPFQILETCSWEQSDGMIKVYVPLRGVHTALLQPAFEAYSVQVKIHNLRGKNYLFHITRTYRAICPCACTAVASKTRKNILITMQKLSTETAEDRLWQDLRGSQ